MKSKFESYHKKLDKRLEVFKRQFSKGDITLDQLCRRCATAGIETSQEILRDNLSKTI